MSIPIFCATCNDVIGEDKSCSMLNSSLDVKCPGTGKHLQPLKTTVKKFWGLIREVKIEYPETNTKSTCSEYIGPRKPFFIWLAIVFGVKAYPNGDFKGILVNGKHVYWNPRFGFYGDGARELFTQKSDT